VDWRPTASITTLARRAALLSEIRRFFAARGVMEVETPSLAPYTVTDPAIDSLGVAVGTERWFLQTSPEFHMKRLLAAGAPAIVRIGPVFRADEQGRVHNPEFTMIEWYRPGFDAAALRHEVAELVDAVLGPAGTSTVTYRRLVERTFAVDPLTAPDAALLDALRRHGIAPSRDVETDRRALLNLLFDAALGKQHGRIFVTDFPAEQAALSTTRHDTDGVEVAERFELVIDGLEIANGYRELADADVLEGRMRSDRERRAREGRAVPDADQRLLAAMHAGLPEMSGVALGFDRLVMLAVGARELAEVIAFPASRA
jgi:lysyl-tRNA synthetase class 2